MGAVDSTLPSELDSVMIDPSLILSYRHFNGTFDWIEKHHDLFRIFIAGSFIDHVESPREYEATNRFYRSWTRAPKYTDVRETLKSYSGAYKRYVPPTDLGRFEGFQSLFSRAVSENARFYDQHLKEIVNEEWIFLQSESVIVSRIKKSLEEFKEGGAASVDFGRTSLRKLISKTRSIPPAEVDRWDALRAVAKWIAVGVPQVIFSDLETRIVSAATGFYLIYAP